VGGEVDLTIGGDRGKKCGAEGFSDECHHVGLFAVAKNVSCGSCTEKYAFIFSAFSIGYTVFRTTEQT